MYLDKETSLIKRNVATSKKPHEKQINIDLFIW